ncbi:MAG: sigma-54-dependent Fis family transcriptional regulator [Planctomycetota bacterium]
MSPEKEPTQIEVAGVSAGHHDDAVGRPGVASLERRYEGWFADLCQLTALRSGTQWMVGLVGQVGDEWKRLSWFGPSNDRWDAIAAEAADQRPGSLTNSSVHRESGWLAMSIPASDLDTRGATTGNGEPSPGVGTRVVMAASQSGSPLGESEFRHFAHLVQCWVNTEDDHQKDSRRLWQVSKMLRAAAAWQRIERDEDLLQAIAECACEVVGCQRATIFLWDRRRKRLIGRPAIGIEGGVLEVEDHAGIVGEVLQSSQPKWWTDGGVDEGRVNRRIDRAQNFHTRSLLAVPMFDARGKMIGVFEAINATTDHRDSETFDAADVWALSELARHAAEAIASQRTRIDLTQTRDRLVEQAATANPIVGSCPAIEHVRTTATRLAATELSVLILGRNGTGKEVLAQHIHYQSERRAGPFVAVNCAALVESLLDSELFGHEKGAFTDASATRAGKFELAVGGTLFLDEIGDLSLGGQAKLLRVLEEKMVVRVGGTQSIPVDVRVIAATNQPLQDMIDEKRFRQDLFFRLNAATLTLPSLQERGNDILELANHFMESFCAQVGRQVPTWSDSAIAALLQHPWPGNVRELRNTIERVCYLTNGNEVGSQDLMLGPVASSHSSSDPSFGHAAPGELELTAATRLFQASHLRHVIAMCDGNMTAAATKLGLHRSNLYRKMRQLDMPTRDES